MNLARLILEESAGAWSWLDVCEGFGESYLRLFGEFSFPLRDELRADDRRTSDVVNAMPSTLALEVVDALRPSPSSCVNHRPRRR